jgi:hypothetical protein
MVLQAQAIILQQIPMLLHALHLCLGRQIFGVRDYSVYIGSDDLEMVSFLVFHPIKIQNLSDKTTKTISLFF